MKFILLAIGVVALLYYTGQFRASTLARGPKREIGMGGFDLAMAVWLFFFGVLFNSGVRLAFLSICGVEKTDQLSQEQQMVLMILTQLAMWGPGIVYLLIRTGYLKKFKQIGLMPKHPVRDLGVAAIATPVTIILATGLSAVIMVIHQKLGGTLPDEGHALLGVLKNTNSTFVIIALTFSAVVVAPVTEELFFRGLLQTALLATLGQKHRWLAILLVSFFFGLIHLPSVPAIMIPSLVVVGIAFGWVYERTGSLLCCILVHMGFNGVTIGLTLLNY